jgi:hypothetical protein
VNRPARPANSPARETGNRLPVPDFGADRSSVLKTASSGPEPAVHSPPTVIATQEEPS